MILCGQWKFNSKCIRTCLTKIISRLLDIVNYICCHVINTSLKWFNMLLSSVKIHNFYFFRILFLCWIILMTYRVAFNVLSWLLFLGQYRRSIKIFWLPNALRLFKSILRIFYCCTMICNFWVSEQHNKLLTGQQSTVDWSRDKWRHKTSNVPTSTTSIGVPLTVFWLLKLIG